LAEDDAVAQLAELLAGDGQRLLADTRPDEDPLAASDRLRRTHPARLVPAALTQARLRARAVEKFGADAAAMYFTPDGLEQATRAEVAAHRAARFARLGTGTPVADLCCGIGADLIALARAGMRVTGVERDPLTAAVARANVRALGLSAEIREGNAEDVDPAWLAGEGFAVFCDPARRPSGGPRGAGGRGRRIFDPEAYAPPLSRALEFARRGRGGCVKVAPGIPHELVPEGAEAEWVSWRGDVKEAALWLGDLAEPGAAGGGRVRRRATLLPSGATLVDEPGLGAPPVTEVGRYLYEPDGAVIRAHLVGEVAAALGGALIDPAIAYVTAGTLTATPFARAYEIDDVLPFSVKRLRAALRERRAGTLTIKKRGSAVDVERLRRDLRPSGDASATVILTRVGEKPYAYLAHPVAAPPACG
jgi:hypothetical protein